MQKKNQRQQKSKIKGQKFESKVQKAINSGSLWFDKGDLKTQDYLIECKYTDKKGFRITTKMLKKIFNDAFDSNKFPVLVIGIQDDKDKNVIWLLNVNIKRKIK